MPANHRPAMHCWLLSTTALLLAGCAHRPAGNNKLHPLAARAAAGRLSPPADWNANHGTLRTLRAAATVATGKRLTRHPGRRSAAPARPGASACTTCRSTATARSSRKATAAARPASSRSARPSATRRRRHRPALRRDAGADYCVDVSGSPFYNRIVDAARSAPTPSKDSTEPMRRDLHADGDQRYREGFVIEHNPRRKPRRAAASSRTCGNRRTAPPPVAPRWTPAAMHRCWHWLDAKQRPVFVLLPQAEYDRLHAAWQLPARAHLSNPHSEP